jgi:hypothetical protein
MTCLLNGVDAILIKHNHEEYRMQDSIQGKRLSGLAAAGFICSCFIGPLGIILSAIALSEVKHNPNTLRGKGMAKWGIGLGILSTVILVLSLCLAKAEADVRRANELSDQRLQEYNRR